MKKRGLVELRRMRVNGVMYLLETLAEQCLIILGDVFSITVLVILLLDYCVQIWTSYLSWTIFSNLDHLKKT